MKILEQVNGDQRFLSSSEIDTQKLSNLNQKSLEILKHLADQPMYPKQLAQKLGVNEQIVYYYIKKLHAMGFIELDQTRRINGIVAKVYKLTADSFFFRFAEFKEGLRIKEKENTLLAPFISQGDLDAIIIVGSPDPHGAQMVRSRDGYLGIDLALFLGSFTERVEGEKVRMDLLVRKEELEEHNLIVVGGPVVNKVAHMIIGDVPVYIDPYKKKIISTLSGKEYSGENIGFISFSKNPFNPKKHLIFISGIRYNGTKAAIVAFTKYLSEIEKGNSHDKSYHARVIEGIDKDFDGVVDDVRFLE